MACKWYEEYVGICCNGDCPERADICPCEDKQSECKFYEGGEFPMLRTTNTDMYYNEPVEVTMPRKYAIRIKHTLAQNPDADIQGVVRCEKCKYLTIHNSPTLYAYCEKTHYEFKPFETDTRTHFCSYGARKEGAKK